MDENQDNFEDINEPSESLNRFEKMLKNNDTYFFDIEEFEEIIEHYLINFNYQYAAKAVRLAIRQHPESLQLKLRKAQLHVINGQPVEALDIIKYLEKIYGKHPDILYLKGFAYTQQEQYDSAILCYNDLLTYPVSEPIVLMQKIAESFLFKSQFDLALLYLLRGLEFDKDDDGLLYNIAFCYHNKLDYDNSVKYYNLYLDQDPFDPLVWTYLAICHYERDEFEKSLDACEYAIAIEETLGNAYYNKANALAALDRNEEAINCYLECLFHDGEEEPEIYCCIGECYERLHDDEKAEENYRHALEINAEYSDAWYGLAMINFNKKNYSDCLKNLKKALYIQPSNPDYWFSLGNLYGQTGDIKTAIESFNKALELNNADFESWINLSDMYYKQNLLSKAIKTLNEATGIIGELHYINYRLAAYYYLKGDPKMGIRYFKKAHKLSNAGIDDFFNLCPDARNFPEIQKLILKKK